MISQVLSFTSFLQTENMLRAQVGPRFGQHCNRCLQKTATSHSITVVLPLQIKWKHREVKTLVFIKHQTMKKYSTCRNDKPKRHPDRSIRNKRRCQNSISKQPISRRKGVDIKVGDKAEL